MKLKITQNDDSEMLNAEFDDALMITFKKEESEESAVKFNILMYSEDVPGKGGMGFLRTLQSWEQLTRFMLAEGEGFEVEDLAEDLKGAIDKHVEWLKMPRKEE